MAVFEIQFESAAFLRAQRARFASELFCPPPPFDLEPLPYRVQIQRLEFGDNAMRRGPARLWDIRYRDRYQGDPPQHLVDTDNDAEGFWTRFVQTVFIHTSDYQAVLAHPNGPSPPLDAPIRVDLVFELDYFPWPDGGCLLQLSLRLVEWPVEPSFLGLPSDLVKTRIEEEIRKAFPARTVPFDFTDLTPQVAKSFPEVANAGVSLSKDLSVLAFRTDPFGSLSGNSDGPWTNFFSGHFENRLAGFHWAIFNDERTLCANVANRIEAALREDPIDDFELDTVSASYGVEKGVPVVTAHVGGFADIPVLGAKYYNFGLRCAISYDSTPPASLVFDIDLTDIETQTKWIGLFFERLRMQLPALGWILEIAFGDKLAKVQNLTGGIDIEPSGFVCEWISKNRRRCRRPAQAPGVPGFRLDAASVSGYPDGFAINGKILETAWTHGVLAVEPHAFAWAVRRVTCTSPDQTIRDARERPRDFSYLYAEGLLKIAGQPPTNQVQFCSLEVINDPQNLYPKGWPQIVVDPQRLPALLTVSMTAPNPLPTYPLDIVIRTSGGVRLLRIPPPVAFADSDATLIAGAIKARMLACPALPQWWEQLENGFDLDWIDDPLVDPDRELTIAHHLDLRVLAEGVQTPIEAVVDGARRVVSEVTPNAGGWSLSMTSPASAKLSLQSLLGGRPTAVRSAGRDESASSELTVTPIRFRSSLFLEQPVRRLELFGRDRRDALLIAGTDSLLLADVTRPQAPKVLRRLGLPSLEGAVALTDGLLAWTARGAVVLDLNLHRRDAARHRLLRVRDATSDGARLFVTDGEGVVAYDPVSFRRTGYAALDGACCLLALSGYLYAGGPFGLAAADLRNDGSLVFRRLTKALDARSLRRGLGARDIIVARDAKGSETAFEVEEGHPRRAMRTEGFPLFDQWTVRGEVLAYTVPGSDTVVIASIGPSRPTVPVLSHRGGKG